MKYSAPALSLVLALSLPGCGLFSHRTPPPAPTDAMPASGDAARSPTGAVRKFAGIPLPANNTLDLDRTVVVGGERDWLGRIFLAVPESTAELVDFYRREMPHYGWTELALTRSSTSVLTYQQEDRIATIQIGAAPSGGATQVEFWVNPQPGRRDQDLQTAEPGGLRERMPGTDPAPTRPGQAGDQGTMPSSPRIRVEQVPLPAPAPR